MKITETEFRMAESKKIPYLVKSLEMVSPTCLHIETRQPVLKKEYDLVAQLVIFERFIAGREGRPDIAFRYKKEGNLVKIEGDIEQAVQVLYDTGFISQKTHDAFKKACLSLSVQAIATQPEADSLPHGHFWRRAVPSQQKSSVKPDDRSKTVLPSIASSTVSHKNTQGGRT